MSGAQDPDGSWITGLTFTASTSNASSKSTGILEYHRKSELMPASDTFLPLPDINAALLHNATLPIHSLPAEIFLDVLFLSIDFIALSKACIPQLHALAQVCAYWLHSIRSNPRFWRLINFQEQQWIDTIALKNPHGRLEVRIISRDLVNTNAFLRVIEKLTHRCEAMSFHMRVDLESITHLDSPTPFLKYLHIHASSRYTEIAFPLDAPALEYLDISNIHVPWDSPSLAGLKYLSISRISSALPSFSQLTTILRASPELQWFGLDDIFPGRSARAKNAIPTDPGEPILLPTLRGLSLKSLNYPAARDLFTILDVPNCKLLRASLYSDQLLQPDSNALKVLKVVTQDQHIEIHVEHVETFETLITITSLRMDEPLSNWTTNLNHSGGMFRVQGNQKYAESWRSAVQVLESAVEWTSSPLSLSLRHRPETFSGDDIGYWRHTSSINFHHRYPYVLSALRYLSTPTITPDGLVHWPCSRLTSISFPSPQIDFHPTIRECADAVGILGFLRKRGMVPGEEELDSKLRENRIPAVLEVIKGPLKLIDEIRGRVPEGLRLCTHKG